ncbi:hypothetical protein [Roseateles sp.]|uniref:hypothetical protein n=1 Tax=Roseateles sp. TaxID=1971397 RepID=UPI0031D3086D
MRERPILFSAPMVRALLAGTKTQTRRVVKHRWPYLWGPNYYPSGKVLTDLPNQPGAFMEFRSHVQDTPGYEGSPSPYLVPCPYGAPGDRLWVRETWQAVNGTDRARHIVTHPRPNVGWLEYAATPRLDEPAYKWRPSIHMPRWACRLVLEITGVRVERLQQITEADAGAEGCAPSWLDADDNETVHAHAQPTYCQGFARLWRDINGPDSWGANPWVWVVEFRRVEGV